MRPSEGAAQEAGQEAGVLLVAPFGADKTSIEVDARVDPRRLRISGIAREGNVRFDVPYISQVKEHLWQGGCAIGLELPRDIEYVVSLYPWESYEYHSEVRGVVSEELYDGPLTNQTDRLYSLARIVNEFRSLGPTLVHCQAGLNRSGLISGLALIIDGMEPAAAITLLRKRRSRAVLCNRAFERWLLSRKDEHV